MTDDGVGDAKTRIVVDEDEPEIDVEETPFELRNVTIRRDKRFADEFEVIDFLGRGRFGEVKRCRELSSGREFAVKFITTAGGGGGGDGRDRRRQDAVGEVNVMRKLRHCRRLVQLYDVFESNRNMCLVLEIVYGGELFDRAVSDDFVLTERACVCFARQICEGVAFIHSKNIVHLDLKPENILCLSRSGNRIKIIDFGLARDYDSSVETRVMFGTPEFVAPEVVQFDPIDFATDMWSVGVICYVLLSGLSPFMGDSDAETMSNVSGGQYEFHSPEFDRVSDDAKDLISQLLQTDKTKRLSATDCLNHRWLKRSSSTDSLQLSKDHLKQFVYRRKWQKLVHAIVALQRMGVDLSSVRRTVASTSSLAATSLSTTTAVEPHVAVASCTSSDLPTPSSLTDSPPTAVDDAAVLVAPPRRRRAAAGRTDADSTPPRDGESPPAADQPPAAVPTRSDAVARRTDEDGGPGRVLLDGSRVSSAKAPSVNGVYHSPAASASDRRPSGLTSRSAGGLRRRVNVIVRERIVFFNRKQRASPATS